MSKARRKQPGGPRWFREPELHLVPEWFVGWEKGRGNFVEAEEPLPVVVGGDGPPLTERERQVLQVIVDRQRITGREIIAEVRRRHDRRIEQGTLTGQIIPKLRAHGVKNRRGVGYYIE